MLENRLECIELDVSTSSELGAYSVDPRSEDGTTTTSKAPDERVNRQEEDKSSLSSKGLSTNDALRIGLASEHESFISELYFDRPILHFLSSNLFYSDTKALKLDHLSPCTLSKGDLSLKI